MIGAGGHTAGSTLHIEYPCPAPAGALAVVAPPPLHSRSAHVLPSVKHPLHDRTAADDEDEQMEGSVVTDWEEDEEDVVIITGRE